MVEEIGCYNIDNNNKVWDNDTLYDMVTFIKFNENEKAIEKKTVYFLIKDNFTCPKFKSESEIKNFLKGVKNFQKFKGYETIKTKIQN